MTVGRKSVIVLITLALLGLALTSSAIAQKVNLS